MDASVRAKFEEHLCCAICLEQFKDPKVLPCLHSYCHECIVKLDKTGNCITCPECRMTVEVGNPPDVSFLPSNFFAKNLLATLSLVSESDSTSITCENCDNGDQAETRCVECNRYLCQFCTGAHRRFRDTKYHSLKTMSELKEGTTPVIAETVCCPKHKGEMIKLYCTTCQETICRDCTIVDHRNHDFSFLEDVAEQEKAELLQVLQDVKGKKAEVAAGLSSVAKQEESLRERGESVIEEITKYFDKMVKAFDAKRNELLEKVTVLREEKLKHLQAQREGLEITLASCNSNIEFTERAFGNGNDAQVLKMKKFISQSLETLKNKEFDVQPCTVDDIEDATELLEDGIIDEALGLFSKEEKNDGVENYTACFDDCSGENWLKIGRKSEIIIKRCLVSGTENSRRHDARGTTIMPVFEGVKVKDVTVSQNTDGSHLLSFVALEAGVLKFELYINGCLAPKCSFSKLVKWEFFQKNSGWHAGSTNVGDCVLEYSIHTWKINLDHASCGWNQRSDFTVGVIDCDNDEVKFVLEGFAKSEVELSLKLDMIEKKLTVTPSWGSQTSSVFDVTSQRMSPFFCVACDDCDPEIIEIGP